MLNSKVDVGWFITTFLEAMKEQKLRERVSQSEETGINSNPESRYPTPDSTTGFLEPWVTLPNSRFFPRAPRDNYHHLRNYKKGDTFHHLRNYHYLGNNFYDLPCSLQTPGPSPLKCI